MQTSSINIQTNVNIQYNSDYIKKQKKYAWAYWFLFIATVALKNILKINVFGHFLVLRKCLVYHLLYISYNIQSNTDIIYNAKQCFEWVSESLRVAYNSSIYTHIYCKWLLTSLLSRTFRHLSNSPRGNTEL